METRNPSSRNALHRIADAGPAVAGIAAYVDEVGAVGM